MIIYSILSLMIWLVAFLMSPFPVITELPFDMDYAFTFFIGTVKGLVAIMPWFGTVWTLLLWALGIQASLYAWHWIKWLIQLVRG